MQFARIEGEVEAHKARLREEREAKVSEARDKDALMECVCCLSDECLLDDMLPCKGGHLFCRECVQRASEVSKANLAFVCKVLRVFFSLFRHRLP